MFTAGRKSVMTLAAIALIGTIGTGCGTNTVTSGSESTTSFQVTDPLAGVLNSVDGTTPTNLSRRWARLAELLGLDETQVAAIIEAETTLHAGMQSLHDQVEAGTITIEDARTQGKALRDAFEASLQVILTAQQWEQLQTLRQNHDGGGFHGNPEERWTGWLNQIGANSDQVTAVLAAFTTMNDALKSIHDQVEAGTLTRDAARTQAEAARAAFDTSLQSILTADQYTALQALRPDCPGMDGNGPPPGPPGGGPGGHGGHR